MTLTWEEAEVAALDRSEWRRSVAQCIHLDAGWIKVKEGRTRNLWHIKRISLLPPHLCSVTALPSKTYTTANIDAHVWLIDVNGQSATTKVTVMRLINNIQARLQCSVCSCILRWFIRVQGASSWLHTMSWIIETLSAVLQRPRTATAWLPFSWPAVVNFLVKRFILATDHLLFGNSFY